MPSPRIDVRSRLIAAALPEDEEFSPARLAEILGIDDETVHRAVERGELPQPTRRTTYRWVFRRADLVAHVRKSVKP